MNKVLRFCTALLIFIAASALSQDKTQMLSADEIKRYEKQVEQLVTYLEGTLNFLGDREAPTKEKEIVINESYLKIFENDKVQVEDDLDENRDVPLHKDVQAYLKDIEFFFRKAEFKFHIVSIEHFTNDQDGHFFKVVFNRDLIATSVTGDTINSRKVRYMEINLNLANNDLRIASIYTTKLNENEEIRNWWNALSANWRKILGANIILFDSVHLSNIVYFEDSLIYISQFAPPDKDTSQHYQLELPAERMGSLEQDGVTDTLVASSKTVMIYLKGLKKQTEIDLSAYESVRNLEPLTELSELTKVNCSNTLVKSLFPLRNLNKLEMLDCSNTPVDDLSPLQYSRSLKELDLAYTLVDDLAGIAGLYNLEVLDLSGLRIPDIEPVSKLKKMKSLKMQDVDISGLDRLSGLNQLQELDISETHVNDLTPVSKFAHLKNLNAEKTMVTRLHPLAGLTSLEVLRISNTLVDSLYPLNDLPNLKKVYWDSEDIFGEALNQKREEAIRLMKNKPGTLVLFESEELLKSWQELEKPWKNLIREATQLGENPSKEELHELLQVETLSLKGKPITTLNPVRRLYNLKTLEASGIQVDDYSPLSEASELESVQLSGSSVKQLNFASKLKKLQVLNIENTDVADLEPLLKNQNLEFIYADESGIDEQKAFAFSQLNPECIVIYDTPGMEAWWNSLSDAWKEFFVSAYRIDAPPSTEQLHALVYSSELEISGSLNIISLIPLTQMKNLEKLIITENQVTSLTPLAELKHLKEIRLNQIPIADLSPLANMLSLEKINIENTPVSDLSPIAGLSNLKVLNISGTQVSDLKDISNLSKLSNLSLNNTPVKRLKHIENISSLKTVECFNTRVRQKDVDRLKAANPECKVVYY